MCVDDDALDPRRAPVDGPPGARHEQPKPASSVLGARYLAQHLLHLPRVPLGAQPREGSRRLEEVTTSHS